MDSKAFPNIGYMKSDMRKSYFWRPFRQKIPPKNIFSRMIHGAREFFPSPSRTMKGDIFMREKLRADTGQSQEPPPSKAERRAEEQEDQGNFEELLAEADEIDENLPFENSCHFKYT